MARARSHSFSPPAQPISVQDVHFDRPASTPPRRRAASAGSDLVNASNEAVRAPSDVPDLDFGSPPTSVSSDFCPNSPVTPVKTAAVSSKARPDGIAQSKAICFQEHIHPLAYHDVPPAFPSSCCPQAPLIAHGPNTHFYHPAYAPQPGFFHPMHYGAAPGYGLPPAPPYSAHPHPVPHLGDPYASVYPAPLFGPYGYTGAPGISHHGTPLFPAPFASPPASPHTSDDGGFAYAGAQQAYYPQQQQHGLGMTLHTPPTPTLRELLEQGEHFVSAGTCKFFDVAKGFGFIIDDNNEAIGKDVFVHYTGIDMSRGFRCLAEGERVEYILTRHSTGRLQALSVIGEHGAPLKGLTDDRNGELARRAHIHSVGSGAARKPKAGAAALAPARAVAAVAPPPTRMRGSGFGARGGEGHMHAPLNR
ncbi:hypothetical protein JCM3770_004058 [Rhodotorula araucariae]